MYASGNTLPASTTAYHAMVDNVTDLAAGARTAATYYAAFNVVSSHFGPFPCSGAATHPTPLISPARQALSRYNCEEQYSHWNCADCRKAYARWACAMTMPACTTSPCTAGGKAPCVRVCNEVVQKCPVTLGFSCPDDNRDYKSSGCNLMGLTAGDPLSLAAPLLLLRRRQSG